jgi:hypothetical protein
MAGRGSQSFKKRQKEQQRKEKQQEKFAKRLQKKTEPRTDGDVDIETMEPLDGPLPPEGDFEEALPDSVRSNG